MSPVVWVLAGSLCANLQDVVCVGCRHLRAAAWSPACYGDIADAAEGEGELVLHVGVGGVAGAGW